MKIHHLDCCTMCPGAERWITGQGSFLARGRLVGHCLLVESASGLVLVETGIGSADIAQPTERLGRFFLRTSRPRLDPNQTALAQLQRLGFAPRDVRHIVLTHAHLDHAGGISDFPHAKIHVYAPEERAVSGPTSYFERHAYRQLQFAHGPDWVGHEPTGDRFFGFDAVRPLAELGADIALVPLPGHTRGHAAVAVKGPRGYLLHAGDAYFHRNQLAGGAAPPLLDLFQRIIDSNRALRTRNLARLVQLAREHAGEVQIFCAHDPVEFETLRKSAISTDKPELARAVA
ncbi:MAG TPA: MBL fold metallo-hydrolase [Polyangiaceae bacterium]|nr:MBL fold metallo-hydrolase [Polyangiaceae bacterium]